MSIKVTKEQLYAFLVKYNQCVIIKGRLLKENEIGINVCVYHFDRKHGKIYIKPGTVNSCMIPYATYNETFDKNTYLYSLLEFEKSCERFEIRKERRKVLDKKQKWQKQTQNRLLKTSTAYENLVYQALKRINLGCKIEKQFIFQYGPDKTMAYFFDIYIPRYKVAIEIDGGYHYTQHQQLHDAKRDYIVHQLKGIKTFRIDNKDVLDNVTLNNFIQSIWSYIQSKR